MMSAKLLLTLLLPPRWRQVIRERIVSMATTHLHGPQRIRLSSNEAAVTCVVRNGAFYIEPFIDHYSRMGFRHIFFLDNGSSDQTISLARKHKNVSVCECRLPVHMYQGLLKKYLAKKSVHGGWCLDADIDELFDYPFSDAVRLDGFLDYLNGKHYTAVVTQLMDMFSDKPLSQLANTKTEDLKSVYQYFDISNLKTIDYQHSELVAKHGHRNEIGHGNTALFFGGIRKTLYGNDCLLTKHSLFLSGKGLDLFPHVHFVNKARLADVSCVMLHYKLTSNALDIARQNKERFLALSSGYDDFIAFLLTKRDYQIKQKTALKFRSATDLVQSGFLFMSDKYREHMRAVAKIIPLTI